MVRAGSCGADWVPAIADPAMTRPTAATAAAGTAQRACRGSLPTRPDPTLTATSGDARPPESRCAF